ncbi:MAG: radical SAM family heme chaperone HemW [Desulfohalobiaceae bacterium]
MLLYIHFPFCRAKCAYCSFYSQPWQQGPAQEYLQLLLQEIRLQGRQQPGLEIKTLYLGGGTPSLLKPQELESILNALHKEFTLAWDLEFSLEANPDSCQDLEKLKAWNTLGVNRLSLGIQSLDDDFLALLGRVHTRDQALRAAKLIRRAGFASLNLDLLWGLPEQSTSHWLSELRQALELAPQHMSCYCLSLEPGNTLQEKMNCQGLQLPAEAEQEEMFLQGAEFLQEQGLQQYEISNFALPGWECRHNQGYWQGRDYLGLGPGAVSTLGFVRSKNPESLQGYAQILRQGSLQPEILHLSKMDKAQELLMLGLRGSNGLDLQEFRQAIGLDLSERNRGLLQALQQEGLISWQGTRLSLTRRGMLLCDEVLGELTIGELGD